MSKSALKLKHFEIFDLNSYFQQLSDDVLEPEEDIVDIIYENSEESKFVFTFLILLSKGSLIYLEYNTTTKKLTKLFKNSNLSLIITNDIKHCELSYSSPIIISTSMNELILIDTKQKPSQCINMTEENINIYSAYCDFEILELKFNCNQSIILVVTTCQIIIYKLTTDVIENKLILNKTFEIKLPGVDMNSIDFTLFINNLFIPRFSDLNENILYLTYTSKESISNNFTKVCLENDESQQTFQFLNIIKVIIGKKDYSIENVKSFNVETSLIKVCFTYFYEKIFFLYKEGIISLVNKNLIDSKENSEIYDNSIIFKYPFISNVKFSDIYFHSSSNFVVVKDTQNDYLIFDFTLNLYYIMNNSKITVKLNMESLKKNEQVNQIKFKSYELNYFLKSHTLANNKKYFPSQPNHSSAKTTEKNDFRIDAYIKNIIYSGKIKNNSMFFYDKRNIDGIFIEISARFNNNSLINPLLDEFQLLKNHLRGQNFDSCFKILMIIENYSLWIQAFILIINKLCHSPTNILLLKKHVLASALDYLNEKYFEDELKMAAYKNIKTICFTSLIYRCLSLKQYEYAYLIAEKFNLSYMYKIILSHAKLNKFMGVSFLISHRFDVNYINYFRKIILTVKRTY